MSNETSGNSTLTLQSNKITFVEIFMCVFIVVALILIAFRNVITGRETIQECLCDSCINNLCHCLFGRDCVAHCVRGSDPHLDAHGR